MFSNRRRKLKQKRMIIAGLSVAVLLFICAYFAWNHRSLPVVTIQVDDISIYPDETVPEFTVHASADKETQKLKLASKENSKENSKEDSKEASTEDYLVQNFMEEINSGEGYQIECNYNSELAEEGDYEIKLILSDKMEENITKKWNDIIKVEIKEGTLKIKNPLGEWEGDKFKRRDGTYASNEFLCLSEDTYYFDEDGNKVTGNQEIWGKEYYFGKDGKFDNEKNEINPALPMIALTFDDGPGKHTERLLDVLEEFDSKATFFMVGTNVNKYPEVVERMKEIGCEIGNHTTDHARLTELNEGEILSQVETTNAAIKKIIEEGATVVRPPYGAVNDLVKNTLDYPLIFWNVDTLDWKKQNVNEIVKYTLEIVEDGDIVLMHDIYETTIDAAIELVPKLIEEGYQLVTVSEMAQARGIQLETGEEYARFRPLKK